MKNNSSWDTECEELRRPIGLKLYLYIKYYVLLCIMIIFAGGIE